MLPPGSPVSAGCRQLSSSPASWRFWSSFARRTLRAASARTRTRRRPTRPARRLWTPPKRRSRRQPPPSAPTASAPRQQLLRRNRRAIALRLPSAERAPGQAHPSPDRRRQRRRRDRQHRLVRRAHRFRPAAMVEAPPRHRLGSRRRARPRQPQLRRRSGRRRHQRQHRHRQRRPQLPDDAPHLGTGDDHRPFARRRQTLRRQRAWSGKPDDPAFARGVDGCPGSR